MTAGPHIVTSRKRGKPVRYYVYAWRGGPQIHVQVGGTKPKISGALIDLIARARAEHGHLAATGTMQALIVSYKDSGEFRQLLPSSQKNYRYYLGLIEDKFGKAPLTAFNSKHMRSDILEWRDEFADRPRTADEVIKVLRRVLYFGVDRGKLERNVAANIKQLYTNNRSKEVWTDEEFAALYQFAPVEVREAVELASLTGMRRGDLVEVKWSNVTDVSIIRATNKSRGRTDAIIPLLPETRDLLSRIKERHSSEMAARRPGRRKDLPETILSNEAWEPWTAGALSTATYRARMAAGITKRLHDLRGTFATRCILAGLSDQQVADIVGWSTDDVSRIRSKYVDHESVMLALSKRLAEGR